MNITTLHNAYLRRIGTFAQPEEVNLLVANALHFIIQNVFVNISNTLVMTISTGNNEPITFWLHDIMGKLFSTMGAMAIQLIVLDHKTKQSNVPGKRYSNMIMTDSLASLVKANIAEYNRNSDNLEYYFIFLQLPDNLMLKEMETIFKYCFENYWLHCNVMVQNAKGEILIYTYFPFKENNCFRTEPELINRFQENHFENDNMFPDKLRNLHKCPLKLSTWELPPFVIKANNKKHPDVPVAGFEILTLITISQRMNFTFDIQWISTKPYKNGSKDMSLLPRLENRQTNITMGYLRRTADRDQIATPSHVTYHIPITAVLIRKPKQNIALGMIAFPFDETTWIMMLVVYVIIGFLNLFVKTKAKGNIFLVFEIIIGVSATNLPSTNAKRIILLSLLFSSFIFRSFYQSLLFFLFRSNFYLAAPTTLEGLVAQGYTALATAVTMQFLHYVPHIENKSLPVIVMDTEDEMVPLRHIDYYRNKSYVAMSITEFAIRYVREELPDGSALRILAMSVKDQQIGFYFSKHSYLSDRFDCYILHFHQAGLLDKWREWTNYDYQVALIPSTTANPDAIMVCLEQLHGFLLLIILMNLIALLIFGLELISKKVLKLEKLIGIINKRNN